MRSVLTAVVILIAFPFAVQADDKADALKKSIDLGAIKQDFELVAAEQRFDAAGNGYLILKVKAKKAVDTSQLSLTVGFFEKDNLLVRTAPLRFDVAFPLEAGESVSVTIDAGRVPDSQNWHKIAVRQHVKPAPKEDPF